jgi:Double zinc ribbon
MSLRREPSMADTTLSIAETASRAPLENQGRFSGIKDSIEFTSAAVSLALGLVTVCGLIGNAWSSTRILYALGAAAVGGSLVFAARQAKVLLAWRRLKSEWIEVGRPAELGVQIRAMGRDLLASVIVGLALGAGALSELIKAIRDDTPETLVPSAVLAGLLLVCGLWLVLKHVHASRRQSRTGVTYCRACDEHISANAAVCKHCGQVRDERRLGRTRCPACDESIRSKARMCHHCGFDRCR